MNSTLEKARVKDGMFASTQEDGFNGAFCLLLNNLKIKCIASDSHGWQHVSVSIDGSSFCPSWDVMHKVKMLFWGDAERVVQFHPPKEEYISNHPGCLHLWKCTNEAFPFPPGWMVGIKELGELPVK
jgi:hypothetical protein